MNRFQFAILHHRYFLEKRIWWTLWAAIAPIQFLHSFVYLSKGNLSQGWVRLALVTFLFMVFRAGNQFSSRNNPMLKTLPLPRGTTYWVDAVWPCALYLIIPLLQEIPAAILAGFPLTDLLWAWLDLIVYHGTLFSAVWCIGCWLPRMKSPTHVLMQVCLSALVLWLGTYLLRAGAFLDQNDTLFDRGLDNVQAYMTSVLICLVVVMGSLLLFYRRLTGKTATLTFHFLMLPLVMILSAKTPSWIEPLQAIEARTSLPTLSQDSEIQLSLLNGLSSIEPKDNYPNFNLQYSGRVRVTAPPDTPRPSVRLDQIALQQPNGRTRTQNPFRSLFIFNEQSSHIETTLFSLFTEWTAKDLADFHGGLVDLSYNFRVGQKTKETLLTGPISSISLNRKQGARNLKLTGITRTWSKSRDNTTPYVTFSAGLSTRQENLIWKRLFRGSPPERDITFSCASKSWDRIVDHKSFTLGAWTKAVHEKFPRNTNRHYSWQNYLKSSRTGEEKDTWVGSLPDEDLQVTLTEAWVHQQWHVELSETQRFPDIHLPQLRSKVFGRNSERTFTPDQSLEILSQISRGRPLSWDTKSFQQWMLQLNRLPPESYKQLLFEATRMEPQLARVILANGWEEDAEEVWFELLSRQKVLDRETIQAIRLSESLLVQKLLESQPVQIPNVNLLTSYLFDRDRFIKFRSDASKGLEFIPFIISGVFYDIHYSYLDSFAWLGEESDRNKLYYPEPYILTNQGGEFSPPEPGLTFSPDHMAFIKEDSP